MVFQFTKKIIALFLTVCLLVTSLCVPVSASYVSTYSLSDFQSYFNGAESPIVAGSLGSFYTVDTMIYNFDAEELSCAYIYIVNYYSLLLPDPVPIVNFAVGDSYTFRFYLMPYSFSLGDYEHFYYQIYTGSGFKFDRWLIYPDGTVETNFSEDADYEYFVGADSFGQYLQVSGKFFSESQRFYQSAQFINPPNIEAHSEFVTVQVPAGLDTFSLVCSDIPTDAVFPDSSDSTVTNANISIGTLHPGDTYVSSVVSVEGLESTDSIYSIRASFSSGDAVVASSESDMFAGPGTFWHLTKNNLSPETDYTLTYTLLENGAETSVTASQTFTTIASADTPAVDDTQTLSLLSAILAAINDQNDRQENEYESIVDILGMLWLRLRYIEENTAALAPSKEEAALKESVKETTQAVVDEVFAEDAPTKVTVDDVKDVAQVGSAAAQMFNPGVGIGSFFDALNNVSFLSVFTQEMVNSMNTVNAVSAISEDGFDSTEYYHKNLEEIRDFVNGG